MKQATETTDHFFVKAPEGNGYTTPEAMQRIDDHIFGLGAWMNHVRPGGAAPDALPVPETDGSWRVEILDSAVGNIVRQIIAKHYGLQIIEPGEAASESKPEENLEASDEVYDGAPEGGHLSSEAEQAESEVPVENPTSRNGSAVAIGKIAETSSSADEKPGEDQTALVSQAEKLIGNYSTFDFCNLANTALNNPGSAAVNYRALAEAMVAQAGKVTPACAVLLTVLAYQEGQSADLDIRFPGAKSQASQLVRSLKNTHQLENYYPEVCAFFQ